MLAGHGKRRLFQGIVLQHRTSGSAEASSIARQGGGCKEWVSSTNHSQFQLPKCKSTKALSDVEYFCFPTFSTVILVDSMFSFFLQSASHDRQEQESVTPPEPLEAPCPIVSELAYPLRIPQEQSCFERLKKRKGQIMLK